MDNFGIIQAFLVAGIFNKFLLIFLLSMSIYSWAIIFVKYRIMRGHLGILAEMNYLIDTKNIIQLEHYLSAQGRPYANSVNLIIDKNKKIPKEDLEIKIELSSKGVVSSMERNVDVLATIASIAPFVGLLGTVLGVINSFNQIGMSASASLAVIAPGIAEALYATALGLFAAIPASAFYNYFSNKMHEYKEKRDFLFNKLYYSLRD